ncbi:MAG: DUF362 domain-containing protein [Anaerolineae bacterium]|nr:DUF362 domain-containing protein [Anaerolineae bacterium]
MSNHISRREFLRRAAVGLSAVTLNQLLTACSSDEAQSIPPTGEAQPTSPASEAPPAAPTNVDEQAESPAQSTSTPGSGPDLVVARSGEPEALVRQAIAALGGMERFVPRDASVIVKPNMCVAYHSYEYAATTNPWVVGALVKMCFEAGARSVQVMDYPFGGTAEDAYEISGVAEQVKAAGGEMVLMSGMKFMPTEIPNALALSQPDIYDDILKADVLINVPIAKHHSLSRLTLGMKNLMGVVWNRPALHGRLGDSLADLAGFIRPALTVIDAVRMLMANGPTGGNLDDVKQMDTIIASPDIVAADSYAATLFDMNPEDLAYITSGVAAGIGRSDLENLRIEEINVVA